jgi:hypothetical protein
MERRLSNKKAQALNMVVLAALTVVIGGIMLVFGLEMLDSLLTETGGKVSNNTWNESVGIMNETGRVVAGASYCEFADFTVVNVSYDNGSAVDAGNWTTDAGGTIYYNGTEGVLPPNNTNWRVYYSYTKGEMVCDFVNTTIGGQGKFADYFDLIVLAVVIAIIVALLLMAFAINRVR